MAKSKYENYTKEQLIDKIKQLEKHRYGLVWEDKQEDVAEQCNKELAKGNRVCRVPKWVLA